MYNYTFKSLATLLAGWFIYWTYSGKEKNNYLKFSLHSIILKYNLDFEAFYHNVFHYKMQLLCYSESSWDWVDCYFITCLAALTAIKPYRPDGDSIKGIPPEDWACSSSVQTCIDPLFYNTLTSASIFLWTYSYFAPQQNLLGLHSECPTILRLLLKTQKVLFVQIADAVISAVKISERSITFLSILFLLPHKKGTQSKNGPCYRKRQGGPSAIKHERNWVHLEVLSSRYLLRNNSNKEFKNILQ